MGLTPRAEGPPLAARTCHARRSAPPPPASGIAPRVLCGRMLDPPRRHAELHHRRPRELTVPASPRHDEDRAGSHGGLDGTLVRQHDDLDLSFDDVEELVPVGMTLPGGLPGVAPDPNHALIEGREPPEGRCAVFRHPDGVPIQRRENDVSFNRPPPFSCPTLARSSSRTAAASRRTTRLRSV